MNSSQEEVAPRATITLANVLKSDPKSEVAQSPGNSKVQHSPTESNEMNDDAREQPKDCNHIEESSVNNSEKQKIESEEPPTLFDLSLSDHTTQEEDSHKQEQRSSQRSSRHSSLELRRLPANILLMPDDSSFVQEETMEQERGRRSFLRMTCLNPKLSLRSQLMLSFDSVNFITIFVVVLICVVVSITTGDSIKEINTATFSNLAKEIQGRTARYLAESLEHRLIPKDTVQIIYQLTRDRFQGYPTFIDDSQVPFLDMDTNTSVYPVIGDPLPLEWEINNLVTAETDEELVQGRLKWYGGYPLSAANAAFIMQGACDPSETNVTSRTYWPNCTDASNDISTGGTMRPSNLTSVIHRKASDLVPTLKALYEYSQDVREIGIYFANQGVGAAVNFPHYELNAQNNYTSIGCEWMKEPNPYNTSRPIGTQEEIDQCYPEGQVLSAREYSPLLRDWCRNQALQPEKILTEGPYLDAFVDNNWLLSSGRAVYDRLTNEFTACIFVGSSTAFLEEIMRESRVTPHSEVSIIRYDKEGTVVASSAWNTSEANKVVTIAELNVGLTNETYSELYNIVDYDTDWESLSVQDSYERFIKKGDGHIVAAYPIPPVPEEYDPEYRPVFFAVVSADEADVFDKVEEVNDDVKSHEQQAIRFAVMVGAAGFVLGTIVILITATAITRPLDLMNNEAKLIVGSFGDENVNHAKQIKPVRLRYSRCVPHTEISDVVNEFNKMIASFSGSSLMAKSEAGKYVEIMNTFDIRDDFRALYASRVASDLPGRAVESPVGSLDTIEEGPESISKIEAASSSIVSSTRSSPYEFLHKGTNLKVKRPSARLFISSKNLRISGKRAASPLFIWTVILIVTPLLLTTITISGVVLTGISRQFDDSVEDSEQHYLDVAVQALSVYVALRADFVSVHTGRSVRDLYLMTRYGNWILFGGVQLAESFTEMNTEVNECKGAESPESCPWVLANSVCDCTWYYSDMFGCEEYPELERQSLQFPYFVVSSDAALPNGTRATTDFPNNSVSPSTTLWWDGPYLLPGSEENVSTGRLATTYDRIRTISAFPLFSVLTNYDIENENSIGHGFAFEEDGAYFADEGCFNFEHAWTAFWQSTEENGARLLRPELCPPGKYGYDPRCREWYDTGRRKAIQNGDSLYITTPYVFAGDVDFIAQSATSPLIDPGNGAHVGQTLQDFSVTEIYSALTSASTPLATGGFPLLITPGTDTFGGDTVLGPGLNGSVSSQPVSKVVMRYDQDCGDDAQCIKRQKEFDEIAALMKSGNISRKTFDRTTAQGDIETVFIVYTPITVKYLDPVDSSDFTRGARVANQFSYSLGLVETVQGLLEPFGVIEADMQRHINVAIGVLAAVIFLAVVTTVGISYLVARSISEPMICLLELIRLVNGDNVDQDPPIVDHSTGSIEITHVSNTMESLYRVVRLANLSFYAGDLEAAYLVLVDAQRLFKRMNNAKAIGVACNNLGVTMLAMYREMQVEGVDSKFGVTRETLIKRGTICFQEAIQLGEKAYDTFFEQEGWSPNCLDFMQQLSNRYFNRGMFLLTVKNDHAQPEEIEGLGFRDLEISRDMDAEIESEGDQVGWGSVNRLQKLFDVRLVRIRGYLLLLGNGYSDDWEIDEKFEELFDMLGVESKKTGSDLFDEVNYVGRLQQAETEMMKYLLIKKEIAAAAKIAIRMLTEDEQAFLDAEATAIKVLQEYIGCSECKMDDATLEHVKEGLDDIMGDLSEYYNNRRHSVPSRAHSVVFKSCRNLGNMNESKRSLTVRWSVSDNSGQFVMMEQF